MRRSNRKGGAVVATIRDHKAVRLLVASRFPRRAGRFVASSATVAALVVMAGGSSGGEGMRLPSGGVVAERTEATVLPAPARVPLAIADLVTVTPAVQGEAGRFSPDALAVPAHRPVVLTFENGDATLSHSLRLELPGPDPTAFAADAASVEVRFRSPGPGVYRMMCEFHRSMRGTLHVIGS